MPADHLREDGTEERGQSRATIAGTGDPHGDSLVLWRIPAAGEGQRRSEAGPRNA